MTRFVKENFAGTEYVTYQGRFVARFKYSSGRASRGSFINFLIQNYTVEEYFDTLNNGSGKAPLDIVRAKGYLQPHIKRMLQNQGYPVTPAGYNMMLGAYLERKYT